MTKTVNQIVAEILEDLGTPAPNELTSTIATRQWTNAFNEFNKRVGEWILTSAKLTANTQNYNMATLISGKTVRDVKYVFNGNSIYSEEVGGVTEYYMTVGLTTTALTGSDIDVINAAKDELSEIGFNFIAPSTLIMLPPPTEAVNMLMLLQVDYTTALLPDEYEAIVTRYAKALCQEIVGNARARLNTPMRQGDYITFSKRELGQYDRADSGYELFTKECDCIVASRMLG